MHGAVDGRSGLGEDAGDAERLVGVLDERNIADPVRDDDLVADLIAERLGHVGADHGVEQILERRACGEGEPVPVPVFVVLEIVERRAQHAEAMMAVAER